MKFRTFFKELDAHERYYSNPGSPIVDSYKLLTDKNGVKDLVLSGKINRYAEIQSHKDSVDIHVILQRFANGDESALTAKKGMYGDFTLVPESIHDLHDRIVDGEFLFNSLPLEERAKFNHSYSQFFASVGSTEFGEWYNGYFGADTDDVNVHVEAPVVDNKEVSADE